MRKVCLSEEGRPPFLLRRAALAVALLLLALPPAARAASFGDVEVNPVRTPGGQPSHGYSEFVFEVKNRGDRTRKVTLTLPADVYSGPRQNGLRAITRSVAVGPGETALVTLLQPNIPEVPGSGVTVTLDGRKQDGGLTVEPVRGRTSYGQGHGSRRRGRYYMSRGSSSLANGPLMLVSKSVSAQAFPDDVLLNLGRGRGGQVQLVRKGEPLTAWSPHWLAYSRYDGIAVTPADLRPGQADPVVQALWQYAEAGGVLLVLGPGAFPMPGTRQRDTSPMDIVPVPKQGGLGMPEPMFGGPGGPAIRENPPDDLPPPEDERPRLAPPSVERYPVGFGLCLVNKAPAAGLWAPGVSEMLYDQTLLTAAPWQSSQGLMHFNTTFPVVEDLGVPVRGLFALIILFGIVIGPVNLMLLARSNRRIWMLWTVPAISLVFCLMVLGYMVVAEGWQGHSRIAGVTVLDENTLRATTLGRAAFYSPLTPGDGLRFSDTTEVTVQGEEHSAFSNNCTLDWAAAGESSEGAQHLSRGWVTARVPAHFAVRKSEPQRRERVAVAREADGRLTMVNGLGVNIQSILLADENGQLYKAGPVGAGDRAVMEKTTHPPVPDRAVPRLRRVYHASDWLSDGRTFQSGAHEYLTRRTYFAVVDSSPFLEQPLRGASAKPSPSYVFGLMAAK